MPGVTNPLVQSDEPVAGAFSTPIDISAGHTAYWHDVGESAADVESDFFLLPPHAGGTGIAVYADLLVLAGVPGAWVSSTEDSVDVVVPEVFINSVVIWAEVRLENGDIVYFEVAESAPGRDYIRENYYENYSGFDSVHEVTWTAEEPQYREIFSSFLGYTFQNGDMVPDLYGTLDQTNTVYLTGRYFVEVQTQSNVAADVWALVSDIELNARYVISDSFHIGESLDTSTRTDVWGSGWLQIVPYVGFTSPSGPPTVSVSDASVMEGTVPGLTQLTFQVQLSHAYTETITVAYSTVEGTAFVGSDFESTQGTLTFAPGQTVQTVTITVYPDADVEPDETVQLFLDSAVNATLGDDVGVGTIVNDDDGNGTIVSPFPEGTGLEPVGDITSDAGHWQTNGAIFDSSLNFYSVDGTILEDFAPGPTGIVQPAATEIVAAIYQWATASTNVVVNQWRTAWLNTGQAGTFVDQHIRGRTETTYGLVTAIGSDDQSYDYAGAFSQLESQDRSLLAGAISLLGSFIGSRLFQWTRTGANHSELSFSLDLDTGEETAAIVAEAGHHDVWLGSMGEDSIFLGDLADVAWGADGNDRLYGESGNDVLHGGLGDDLIDGGSGADVLFGGGGSDAFAGSAAELNNDTIVDFTAQDAVVIEDADLATFSYSLSGTILTYTGGSLTLAAGVSGPLVARAAAGGGVELTIGQRATLTLTASGQDFTIGGDVLVYGTTAAGEVIELLHGDVRLDASFNIGGDTVVLPGNAGSYTAVLAGSFVTIDGGGLTVAIPVGIAGLNVQFADSTRVLRFDTGAGQVMLGAQAVTSVEAPVAAIGAPLSDPFEVGPDSLGRLVLAEVGQDIDIGGNVSIFGSTAPGEVITILEGTVVLDASFNAGGDTVVLPGNAGSYSATLAGSFVTIAGGGISVAIPVGIAGLTVDFADADRVLRFDTSAGQVMLGGQAITAGGAPVAAARLAMDAFAKAPLADDWAMAETRLETVDSFVLG